MPPTQAKAGRGAKRQRSESALMAETSSKRPHPTTSPRAGNASNVTTPTGHNGDDDENSESDDGDDIELHPSSPVGCSEEEAPSAPAAVPASQSATSSPSGEAQRAGPTHTTTPEESEDITILSPAELCYQEKFCNNQCGFIALKNAIAASQSRRMRPRDVPIVLHRLVRVFCTKILGNSHCTTTDALESVAQHPLTGNQLKQIWEGYHTTQQLRIPNLLVIARAEIDTNKDTTDPTVTTSLVRRSAITSIRTRDNASRPSRASSPTPTHRASPRFGWTMTGFGR
eukprot:m.257645 g.257645  ORF g.257645 m.257645 type:complete len:285 (-) comp11032_c0_seq15:3296-4150(-)